MTAVPLPDPGAELAMAAWHVSSNASPDSMRRLADAVATFDRLDVPVSHRALLDAARQAVEAAPDQWARHGETLNGLLRDLPRTREGRRGDRWADRKDLQ